MAVCAYCGMETDKPVLMMNLSEHIEWDSCLDCLRGALFGGGKALDMSLVRKHEHQTRLTEYCDGDFDGVCGESRVKK